MAPKESERNTAFAAGKLAGEDAFDQDSIMDMTFYGLRVSEIPEKLREEFKQGWQYAVDTVELPNYTRTNDITRIRIRRLIDGRPQVEDTPASIIVAPRTVDRVQRFLQHERTLDMDTVVNLALDTFDLFLWTITAEGMEEGLVPRIIEDRYEKAIKGTSYWDILDEGQEVHHS